MRRCHLRGRENILKRQLAHVSAFNLSLVMRQLLGAGTPRELKNRATGLVLKILGLVTRWNRPDSAVEPHTAKVQIPVRRRGYILFLPPRTSAVSERLSLP